jgi:hypothetical protein
MEYVSTAAVKWSRRPEDQAEVTNYTELSLYGQAVSSLTSQELPALRNPEVHYRVNNSPQLVPILNQINLINATLFNLSVIHLIMSHLRLGPPK